MPKQDDSLVERVDKLFSSLAATAANLNNTSKELSAVIAHIEGALQRLNLGVTAWTVMTQGGSALTSSGSRFESEELGYGRTGRKSWGLMLRKGGWIYRSLLHQNTMNGLSTTPPESSGSGLFNISRIFSRRLNERPGRWLKSSPHL